MIGALAGGAAAIAGQLFTARSQSQLEHGKVREARVEELREVLDAASLALMKGIENYDWVVDRWQPGMDAKDESVPTGDLYEVRRQESRLAVRVADQDVFVAYRDASRALWTIFDVPAADRDVQRQRFAARRV